MPAQGLPWGLLTDHTTMQVGKLSLSVSPDHNMLEVQGLSKDLLLVA